MIAGDHHRWSLLFLLMPYCMNVFRFGLAYKKPTFCDQSGEPFSFLWTIKRDPPSYLFGTIHVPYTKVWSHIPENAKQAFAASSQVYFELDLVNPTTVSALSSCQMLPQGKNLSDVLPGDLYSRLKRHLEYVRGMMPHWMTADQRGRGLYADYLFNAIAGNWERKRPVWVMLMVNSLTESDVRSRGVPVLDLYLAQEAERMKKKTAAVERVEEQCLPLNGLNFTQVLFALNHTLLQHEMRENESSYTTEDLIRHYNCGDLSAGQDTAPLPTLSGNSSLSEEEAALARNIDHYFRQELIYNRNMRMGGRVAHLMRHNPDHSLFFAFGAGHFLGNNTVLDFVQAHGFEIEHVTVNAKLPKKPIEEERTPQHGEIEGGCSHQEGSRTSIESPPQPELSAKVGSELRLHQRAPSSDRATHEALQRPLGPLGSIPLDDQECSLQWQPRKTLIFPPPSLPDVVPGKSRTRAVRTALIVTAYSSSSLVVSRTHHCPLFFGAQILSTDGHHLNGSSAKEDNLHFKDSSCIQLQAHQTVEQLLKSYIYFRGYLPSGTVHRLF